MARKKKRIEPPIRQPQIIVTYPEDMTTIDVVIHRADKINARILQRTIRQITRQRRIELKKIIYKDRLAPEDYDKRFSDEGVNNGRRRQEKQRGREAEDTGDDSDTISRLTEEAARNL